MENITGESIQICFDYDEPDQIEEILKNSKFSKKDLLLKAAESNKEVISFSHKDSKFDIFWNVRCLTCNYKSVLVARKFERCSGCYNKDRVTNHSEFLSAAYKKHNNRYKYLGVYEKSYKKLEIFCIKCQKSFFQSPDSHLSGIGCPRCKMSKGELRIEKYFIENDIKYIPQQTFETLRYRQKLKVDFYLPDYDYIVEYDGEGHDSVDFYIKKRVVNPMRSFMETLIRDQIKNYWAVLNNKSLLRIHHSVANDTEVLLDEFLGIKNAK